MKLTRPLRTFTIFHEIIFYVFVFFSEQRILLISNPLQNTLKELWTMIHFLLPGITRPFSDFPVKAGTDQNQDYCHKLVIRLHRVGAASARVTANFLLLSFCLFKNPHFRWCKSGKTQEFQLAYQFK